MNESPADAAGVQTFPEDRPSSAGAAMAAVALLLVLALVGWEAWQWWQSTPAGGAADPVQAELGPVRSELAQTGAGIERLDERVTALEQAAQAGPEDAGAEERAQLRESLDALSEAVSAQAAQLDAAQAAVQGMNQRLASAEAGVAGLLEESRGPDRAVELAGAEFLVRMANERLQLFSDVRGALRALELAERQLARLDAPMLASVRQDLAADLEALRRLRLPDAVGLEARLAALQADVPALAFPDPEAEAASDQLQENAGWWARLRHQLGQLVTVRRRVDEADVLTIEDQDLLRQSVWVRLEAARLALARLDDAGWQSNLEAAGEQLDRHFDLQEAPASAMAEALDELSDVSLDVPLPDIGATAERLAALQRPTAPPLELRPVPAPTEDRPGSARDSGNQESAEQATEREEARP